MSAWSVNTRRAPSRHCRGARSMVIRLRPYMTASTPPPVLRLLGLVSHAFAPPRPCHGGALVRGVTGWFCPPGTIDPFSFACGGPEYYCPEGSGRRLPVDRGFYAGGIGIDRAGGEGGYSFQVDFRTFDKFRACHAPFFRSAIVRNYCDIWARARLERLARLKRGVSGPQGAIEPVESIFRIWLEFLPWSGVVLLPPCQRSE